jgi:hypothetical protein
MLPKPPKFGCWREARFEVNDKFWKLYLSTPPSDDFSMALFVDIII